MNVASPGRKSEITKRRQSDIFSNKAILPRIVTPDAQLNLKPGGEHQKLQSMTFNDEVYLQHLILNILHFS